MELNIAIPGKASKVLSVSDSAFAKEYNEEVKILVTNNQIEETTNSKKNSKPTSIENSILEKIK